jgi:DNA polymerase
MAAQTELFSQTVLSPCGEEVLVPIRQRAIGCQACPLWQYRTKVVFGVGKAENPPICFVGEGPGFNEDQAGEPFVGTAGKLLTRMIEAMGFSRADIYIVNIVCCRPPNNRKPLPEEIAACKDILLGQIRAIRPKTLVALGGTAVEGLIGKEVQITKIRGKWLEFEGVPLMPTLHPAALLRQVAWKAMAWEDLQQVREKLSSLTTLSVPGML